MGELSKTLRKGRIFAFSGVVGTYLESIMKRKKEEIDLPVAHSVIHFLNFLLIDDFALCQLTFLYDDPQSMCL